MRLLKIGAIVAGGLLVVAIAALLVMRMLTPDYGVYDRDRWVAEKSAKPGENRRSMMVSDIGRHLRAGMTKRDVVDLLGQPDGNGEFRFSYDLGTPGYGVDYEYFIVEFDPDERVTRWRVERG